MLSDALLAVGAVILAGSFAWTIYWIIDVIVLGRVYLDVHNEKDGRDYHKKVRPKNGGYLWRKGLDDPEFIDFHESKATSYKGRPKYRAIVPGGDVYKPSSDTDGGISLIDGVIRARALKTTAAAKLAHSSGDDSEKWRALTWIGAIMAIGIIIIAYFVYQIVQGGGLTGA